MTYQIFFTPQALDDLSRFDVRISKRVVGKIQWLAEQIDHLQPETLTGAFSHLCQLRVGDWRVLYTVDQAQHPISCRCPLADSVQTISPTG